MAEEPTELSPEAKERIDAVLTRAASDIKFREALLSAPRTALRQTNLTEDEIELVATMQRVGMEEWGIDVRKFRSFLRDNGNSAPVLRFAIEDTIQKSALPGLDLNEESKKRIESVLDRAAKDIKFRDSLLADTDAALKEFDLTDRERKIVASMRRVGLEEWGIDVRPFRAFLRDNGASIDLLSVAIADRQNKS